MIRASFVTATVTAALSLALTAETIRLAPRIWDDRALADWATPIAGLDVRPGHYSATDYYAVPADNLRTYPVYHPDAEPPGYWADLQKKKPEPLIDTHRPQRPRTGSRKASACFARWTTCSCAPTIPC